MIIVFDSGVWISALMFAGTPLNAINCAGASQRIAFCDEIVNEVCRVCAKKFGRSRPETLRSLEPYLEDSLHIQISGTLDRICRDPNDDMVLECALLANANLIVTGDRDLLVLNSCKNIQILTARQYLDAYA